MPKPNHYDAGSLMEQGGQPLYPQGVSIGEYFLFQFANFHGFCHYAAFVSKVVLAVCAHGSEHKPIVVHIVYHEGICVEFPVVQPVGFVSKKFCDGDVRAGENRGRV